MSRGIYKLKGYAKADTGRRKALALKKKLGLLKGKRISSQRIEMWLMQINRIENKIALLKLHQNDIYKLINNSGESKKRG